LNYNKHLLLGTLFSDIESRVTMSGLLPVVLFYSASTTCACKFIYTVWGRNVSMVGVKEEKKGDIGRWQCHGHG